VPDPPDIRIGAGRVPDRPDIRTTVPPDIRPPQPDAIVVPDTAPKPLRIAAIFVRNLTTNKALDDKLDALEQMVAGATTDGEFSVISPQDVVSADLNDASAVDLARNMGADYAFVVTFSSYGQSKKTFKGVGIETVNVDTTLRTSYKLLYQATGGSLAGDTVTGHKMVRSDVNGSNDVDVTDDLVADASNQLTDSLKRHIFNDPIPVTRPSVRLTVVCSVQGMTVPDVVRNDKGEYVLSDHTVSLEPTNVVVELNGLVIGTAPNTFSVPKGTYKIRLRREGCKDWTGKSNVVDGMELKIDLQQTDEAYARWLATTGFLADLKAGEKLTDAQVKVLEGLAQTLRQSGYKVDAKSDVKINSDLKGLVQNSIW
jgi:hypothetical protein